MNARIIVVVAVPLVSAFVGWATNYIAVKMLFRPRNPVRFAGMAIQGLLPRRRSELARTIGETVERELLSHRDIEQALCAASFRQEISRVLRRRVDDFFDSTFGANPLFAMFLGSDVAASAKDLLVVEVEKLIPGTVELLLANLESKLDFKEIVRTRIEGFELDRLERIVAAIASRELRAIELFGGVLGFLVGIVQVIIIMAVGWYG